MFFLQKYLGLQGLFTEILEVVKYFAEWAISAKHTDQLTPYPKE